MARRMRLRDRIALRRAQAAERRDRKPEPPPEPRIEIALRKAGSIGALERLAGIGPDPASRALFWMAFSSLPARECLDAGCEELRRRARLGAA